MTATAAKRKTARKKAGPSTAELKRQLAAERKAKDDLQENMNKLMNTVGALSEKVEHLASLPTASQARAEHDPNARIMGQVFHDETPEDLPPKPENHLPDHLKNLEPLGEPLEDETERGREYRAEHHPRIPEKGWDSREQDVGEFRERRMKSEGPARESLEPLRPADDAPMIENKKWSPQKLAHEAFMHELVCVRVHDTTDETQTPLPEVGNGGIMQYFIRNQKQWVKRKFIEPLARAKRTVYSQKVVRNDRGDTDYIEIPHTTLLYPFEVLEDTPKGRAWLRGILAEPY